MKEKRVPYLLVGLLVIVTLLTLTTILTTPQGEDVRLQPDIDPRTGELIDFTQTSTTSGGQFNADGLTPLGCFDPDKLIQGGQYEKDQPIFCALSETFEFLGDLWSGRAEIGVIGQTAKWLILVLLIMLIYSALQYIDFPENQFAQFILATIVGFLATVLISTQEVIAILISYTALGIALITFLPIMILGFFSIVMATKGSPMGIYLQKILWLAYSLYLFIKAGALFLVQSFARYTDPENLEAYYQSSSVQLFLGDSARELSTNSDPIILFMLIFVAILTFVIAVWRNDFIVDWLAHEYLDSASEADKRDIDFAREWVKNRADDLMGNRRRRHRN